METKQSNEKTQEPVMVIRIKIPSHQASFPHLFHHGSRGLVRLESGPRLLVFVWDWENKARRLVPSDFQIVIFVVLGGAAASVPCADDLPSQSRGRTRVVELSRTIVLKIISSESTVNRISLGRPLSDRNLNCIRHELQLLLATSHPGHQWRVFCVPGSE